VITTISIPPPIHDCAEGAFYYLGSECDHLPEAGENISNIYEKMYYYELKNYKCKMLICHENNWLFKILFHDYLDGETEYKKNYQGTVIGKEKNFSYLYQKLLV